MSGFGRYHPFTAKSTLLIFALLMVAGFGTMFVQIPFLPLLTIPVDIVHGLTVGMALNMSGVSLPSIVQQASVVVTYYLFSVILGYIVHSFVGGNSI